MPFDPTYPVNDSQLTSAGMRAQFNALNDLITGQTQSLASLTARVAALEGPTTLTATGFGDARANGVLTQMGMFAGKPYFQIAGGWWAYWNVMLTSWEIGATDPNEDQDRKYNSYGDIPLPTNPWLNDGGPYPGGTVS
jgi:hypothetical protein